MPCGVKSCGSSDDRFLWSCFFCSKEYHAACVGVQRQREHFITAFMVPMCADCQDILRKEVDVRKMLHQQEQLVESIRSQIDTNQRVAADLKRFSAVSVLFESIEQLLNDVNNKLSIIDKSNKNMCSAVCQHIKSCDSQVLTTINGINESNNKFSQKITTILDERLPSLTNDEALLKELADAPTPQLNCESTFREILEEIKFVSGAVSGLQTNLTTYVAQPQKTLDEELAENSVSNNKTTQPNVDHSSPGWRFLGNKWRWMQDWSGYDAKQQTRRLQEKVAEKARRNRKRRKQQRIKQTKINGNSAHTSNIHKNIHQNEHIRACKSDKQLLATAKVQFAGPPSTTDHPIAGLSVPKLINFRKGETINPYRTENQAQQNICESSPAEISTASTALASRPTPCWTPDPLRPPIVNLTQQSANGDGRFLKARLRDPKIMHLVRLYLAYMHDKDPTFCYDGMTNTSIKMNLASEGLPVAVMELRNIFFEVHEEFGVPKQAASDDLVSYCRHLNNQRIQYLQRIRESNDKFHKPARESTEKFHIPNFRK